MASRAVGLQVEIILSLALKDFLVAVGKFNHAGGKVKVFYSNIGFTFQATSQALPDLLKSPQLRNYLQKTGKAGNSSTATLLVKLKLSGNDQAV